MKKYYHLNFSLFDYEAWIGSEWELDINFIQFGQRSLLSFSGGKNYQTTLQIFFIRVLDYKDGPFKHATK